MKFKQAGLRQPRCLDAREQRREHVLHLRQGCDGADVPVRDQADFEKALGKNLGLARLPQSGPHSRAHAANSFHNWVIPKNAGNKTGAWEFIKLAVDNKGASQTRGERGRAAHQQGRERDAIKDPLTKFFLKTGGEPAGAAARQHRAR